MSGVHRVPMRRVRAWERVLVVHHDDGSRTICDANGVPDRFVPASMTMRQFRALVSKDRRRAYRRGFRAGVRLVFWPVFMLGWLVAVALTALLIELFGP